MSLGADFVFVLLVFSFWIFVRNCSITEQRGVHSSPHPHEDRWTQWLFLPIMLVLAGTTPTHFSAEPPHLLCCDNATCNILPWPPFLSVSPSPFASYLEIMTSIRFNIKQLIWGMLWIVEEEEEICRWASVKCLHMPGMSACEGRGWPVWEEGSCLNCLTPFHSVIMGLRYIWLRWAEGALSNTLTFLGCLFLSQSNFIPHFEL